MTDALNATPADTALTHALWNRDLGAVRAALAQGADPNLLLEEPPAPAGAKRSASLLEPKEQLALTYVLDLITRNRISEVDGTAMVEALMAHGADANRGVTALEYAPLTWAVMRALEGPVRSMLAHGGQATLVLHHHDQTLFHVLGQMERQQGEPLKAVAQALVDAGGHPAQADTLGYTPLQTAVRYCYPLLFAAVASAHSMTRAEGAGICNMFARLGKGLTASSFHPAEGAEFTDTMTHLLPCLATLGRSDDAFRAQAVAAIEHLHTFLQASIDSGERKYLRTNPPEFQRWQNGLAYLKAFVQEQRLLTELDTTVPAGTTGTRLRM